MRLNLLSSCIIALIAIAMIPTANTQNAAHKNASSSSPSDQPTALEVAARSERNIFRGYVAFLVIAALGTAALTIWLRGANAKYLEAVREDARVRIATVESNAKIESQRVEKEANVRIQEVKSGADVKIAEQHNLALGLQAKLATAVAESRSKQADLEREQQKTAVAQAKLAAEQQEAAKAQEEAAKAQLALKEHLEAVAREQRPRHIDGKIFVAALAGRPKARVQLRYANDSTGEPRWVAQQLYTWLTNGTNGPRPLPGAGWDASPPEPLSTDGKPSLDLRWVLTGIGFVVKNFQIASPSRQVKPVKRSNNGDSLKHNGGITCGGKGRIRIFIRPVSS